MPALIVAVDLSEDLRERIPKFFDDYCLLELTSDPDRYYEEAHKVDIATRYYPVFLITFGNITLNAIVAARLANLLESFFVVEPQAERFRVLDGV